MFIYKTSFTYHIYRRGFTFGQKFFAFTCNALTEEQLSNIVLSLDIPQSYDTLVYCEGFIDGYLLNSVNMLTVYTKESIMAKIGQASEQARKETMVPFATMEVLAENAIPFCIRSINEEVGQFGKQWKLLLLVDEAASHLIEVNDNFLCQLSMPIGTPQRDRMMELLREDLPAHCGIIIAETMKNGKVFYRMDGEGDECVCGYHDKGNETNTDTLNPTFDPTELEEHLF